MCDERSMTGAQELRSAASCRKSDAIILLHEDLAKSCLKCDAQASVPLLKNDMACLQCAQLLDPRVAETERHSMHKKAGRPKAVFSEGGCDQG